MMSGKFPRLTAAVNNSLHTTHGPEAIGVESKYDCEYSTKSSTEDGPSKYNINNFVADIWYY